MISFERCTLPDNHKDFFTSFSHFSYMCSNEKAFLKFGIKFTGSTNSTPLLHLHNAFSDFRLEVQQTLARSIFEITGHALPAKLKYKHKTKKNTSTLLS